MIKHWASLLTYTFHTTIITSLLDLNCGFASTGQLLVPYANSFQTPFIKVHTNTLNSYQSLPNHMIRLGICWGGHKVLCFFKNNLKSIYYISLSNQVNIKVSQIAYFCSATGTTPHMSRPSSVRVPVLSKQTVLMAPHRLIRRGLMQKMSDLRRRFCANTIPTVMAAGNDGGTTIVTRSRVRTKIRNGSSSLVIWKRNINHVLKSGEQIHPTIFQTASCTASRPN